MTDETTGLSPDSGERYERVSRIASGGMGEWDAAGRPMVSETGRPPYVV